MFDIESWKEINDNMAELIKTFGNYNTVILNTIDTLLDYIGAWIIDQEPKLARNKLQFYGKLKDEFSYLIHYYVINTIFLIEYSKIFITHSKHFYTHFNHS
jgi:hypothetical protein